VSEPRNIVVVTHYYPSHGGGVELVAFELARRLSATSGLRVVWFASDTDVAPQSPALDCEPVPAWNFLERRLGVPWPIWSPFRLRAMWRAIGASRGVHIHDTLYMGNVLAALMARIRRKPLVVTQHIGLVPYKSRVLRGIMAAANRLVALPVLRRATKVVFISHAVRAYFEAMGRMGTTHLVPNGVDTDLYRPPTSRERAAARASFGLRQGDIALVFVGRFVEKKGLALMERLARQMSNVQWLLAGDGPIDPDEWKLPNVRCFRGRRRETLRELLWAGNLLVLPSTGEGFPLVVQEAMATGLACIVSEETLEGYPAARGLVLSEPLGEGAFERWLVRLQAISERSVALPEPDVLADFAKKHWCWNRASAFYEKQFTSLADTGR